ncbi:MORC family CW-type zinc finger protein 3-like isoform X2 [Salvelinus fontinalis]|uniref:MORC family CW-type zinc finger protein 3-like isoform X2 n=1 Tax=Salvelinus fontinalis TaxID=8038 RepID=UPI00248690D7|nr:MORC family CW-type zinc finger protein 3-like isoform X2 [Salvelinus fontinalis]
MARFSEHGIRLSSMSPSFLNSNSTSHTWPFSAVAELIDNASDPGVTARQIWIDVVEEQQQLCLAFTDNGSGMTPNKLHKMLSFGFTEKGSGKGSHQAIGVYGNGFKSGSMRLGRDALIFTKNGGCLTVGMLSQSYLQAVKAQAVIVPIVPFNQQTKVLVVTEDSEASLNAILTHSLIHTQKELLQHFDSILSKKGTKILIWNIRRNKDGKPELDFETDEFDIRMPEIHSEETKTRGRKKSFPGPQRTDHTIPEMDYSLRAYLSILYLKPRTQIILRQKKVQTKLVAKSLSQIENDVYKPQFNKDRVKVTFGFNRKNKDHYGIMMYHKNRLIKSYEKVGYQIKSSGQRAGVGVIGVIECNFLKPAHNKQDFEYTKEYRLTLSSLGLKLNDYWNEMMEKKAREREFLAAEKKNEEEEEEEEEESPVWLQCEDCLRWRRVPEGHYSSTPEHWNCSQNPNTMLRSCSLPEEAEESEEELTPSYQKKTYKKDQGLVRKRGRPRKHHVLPQGLSEPVLLRPLPRDAPLPLSEPVLLRPLPRDAPLPLSEPVLLRPLPPDAPLPLTEPVLLRPLPPDAPLPLTEPVLLRPLPPDAPLHLLTEETENSELNKTVAPLVATLEDDEDSMAQSKSGSDTCAPTRACKRSYRNKRKSIWPPRDMEKRPQPWAGPHPFADEIQDVQQPGKAGNEPQTLTGQTEKTKGEKAPLGATRGGLSQPSSSLAWPPSLTSAQTVVVSPLSRPEGPWPRALTLEGAGSERGALVQRLAGLEKEAQRLRRILGSNAPPATQDTVVMTEAASGDKESGGAGAETTVAMVTKQDQKECESSASPGIPVVPGLAVEGVQPQREQPELGRLRREKADPQSRLRQTDSPVTRDQSSRIVQENLYKIRGNVVALLSAILPHLDLQGISLDTPDVDSILQQIIDANSLSPL